LTDGQRLSKLISQTYLGKATVVEAAVAGATSMPDRSRHLVFPKT